MIMATEYLVESRWKVGYDVNEGFYYLEDTQPIQAHEGRLYSYLTGEEVNRIAELYLAVLPIKNEVKMRVIDLGNDDGWYLNLRRNFDGDLQVKLAYSSFGVSSDLVSFIFNDFSEFGKVVYSLSKLYTELRND